MHYIQSLQDLHTNMETLDHYLDKKVEPFYDFARNLIKNGICFVAVQTDHGYHFYPSRFLGYARNNMNAHLNNAEKDGRETNPVISNLLNQKPLEHAELESIYQKYCGKLGFQASSRKRKFWVL